MGRTHTALEYKAIIRKLLRRVRIFRSVLTSSLASLAKHRRLRENDEADCRRQFRHELSFIFSARPGTPAADMVDDVRKKRRSSVCIFCKSALISKRGMEPPDARHHPAHSGRRDFTKSIMELSGRTENNRVVNFEARRI